MAITLALLAAKVSKISYPDPSEILEIQGSNASHLRRIQIANFLVGYRLNSDTNRVKAGYLEFGQFAFVAAAAFLLLAAVAVVGVEMAAACLVGHVQVEAAVVVVVGPGRARAQGRQTFAA